jgi:hypothetical protein
MVRFAAPLLVAVVLVTASTTRAADVRQRFNLSGVT